MARLFDDASSEGLKVSSKLVSYPFAMSIWFRSNDGTINQDLMTLCDTGGTKYHALLITSTSVLRARSDDGTPRNSDTAATWSTNTWHNAVGIFRGSSGRTALLDGSSSTTDTNSVTITTEDATIIGHRQDSGGTSNHFSGDLAEAAVWDLTNWGGTNVERENNFTAWAVSGLAIGMRPLAFRLGLVGYWPIFGNDSPEPDWVGGNGMALVATPTKSTSHPPVIYPAPIIIPGVAGAAPPGTNPKNPFGLALQGPMSRGVL